MISLADLRARNVTPIWQEAVAVIQELIQTVKATTGSAELLPDLEHIALIPNGDVVALPGSPETALPVRHAAVMLKLLIDGIPVPPELEQFVGRNLAEPPQYDTVAEFSRNLAFFERPGRRSDVERLAGRALAAEQNSRAEEELQRLKARASEVTQVMAPPELLQQQQKVKTVPIALVAAVGAATIGVALWALTLTRTSQSPAEAAAANSPAAASAPAGDPAAGAGTSATPAPVAVAEAGAPGAAAVTGSSAPGTPPPPAGGPGTATPTPAAPPADRSLLGRASDAVRTAVNTLVGSKDAPAPAMASAPPSAEAKRAAAPRTTTRRRAATTPKPAVPDPVPPAPVAVAPPTPVVVAPTQDPVVEPAPSVPVFEAPIEVYTAADAGVTPAVIVRPVLPKELPPGVPPDQVGHIEVIVDENGDVLHVKLLSPANRFHERMLVSAAKMWKFRPAYKDGRAVRYKTQVRLTI